MRNKEAFNLNKKSLRELYTRINFEEKVLFAGTKRSEKFKNIIPKIQHLEKIISEMFWASTKLEEGRQLRFRVVYSTALGKDLGLMFDPLNLKEWNSEEIKKLAPAVVPPNGAMCVYPHPYLKEDKLYIQGLTISAFTFLQFEIIEPARMVISLAYSKIAEINGGNVSFFDNSWSEKISNLMILYELKEENKSISNMLSLLYLTVTQETLKRIRLLRHGGTIIFVPKNKSWKKSIEKPMSYDCMLPYNGLGHIEKALNSEFQEIINKNTEKLDHKIFDAGMKLITSERYKAFISDAARNIAYLTAVDGAVILSKNFDVLAFGAKIKEKQAGRNIEKVTKIMPYKSDELFDESSLSHEFRGKRHLSTARFVLSNPDSVAFTVSQDGGITGFEMKDGKLIAYKGLELSL